MKMTLAKDLKEIVKAGFCISGGSFGCTCKDCSEVFMETLKIWDIEEIIIKEI